MFDRIESTLRRHLLSLRGIRQLTDDEAIFAFSHCMLIQRLLRPANAGLAMTNLIAASCAEFKPNRSN